MSLRWPRILGFDEGSEAAYDSQINVGDQLVAVNGNVVVGAKLDETIPLFAQARASPQVELYLFRGDTKALQDMVVASALRCGKEVSYAQRMFEAVCGRARDPPLIAPADFWARYGRGFVLIQRGGFVLGRGLGRSAVGWRAWGLRRELGDFLKEVERGEAHLGLGVGERAEGMLRQP